MDDAQARFDRWTQGFGAQRTRRGLGGLAVGVLAAVGLMEAADAKGKKGKKKKKKKKKGKAQIPPPVSPPPPPPPRTCLPQGSECRQGVDTCCSSEVSSVNPICSRVGSEFTYCCFPPDTHFPDFFGTQICCGGGWKPDREDDYYGAGACCIGNDIALVSGDTPEQCCKGPHVHAGRCALPPGHTCYQDSFSLCWDGSRCNGQRCPDA